MSNCFPEVPEGQGNLIPAQGEWRGAVGRGLWFMVIGRCKHPSWFRNHVVAFWGLNWLFEFIGMNSKILFRPGIYLLGLFGVKL